MASHSFRSLSCRETRACWSAPGTSPSGSSPTIPCSARLRMGCSATRWSADTAWRLARRSRPSHRFVRVVAGKLGGRPLLAPRGRATRPTSDRVREALFSMLGALESLHVLDLFAGSGALGIEALSRGASSATLIDSSPAAVAAIKRNLEALDLDAEVRRQDF